MLGIWDILVASGFIWAIPLGIAGIIFWFVQYRADRTIKRFSANLSNTSLGLTAEEAAKLFLTVSGSGSISVKPGLDHRRNVCDPETGNLLIAPGFWVSRTPEAVAMAFRAAGLASVFHRTPARIRRIRRLDVAEQVLFWIMFVVMGFGLMGASIPVTLAAYGLFGVTLGCFFVRLSLERRLDGETLRLIRERELIDQADWPIIEKIFRADLLSFCHRFCAVERPQDPEIHEAIPAAAFSTKILVKTADRVSRSRREGRSDSLPDIDDYALPTGRKYRQR